MSCIVWNVRGLGNQRAFRELKRLIADKSPSLLFLCETRKRDFNNRYWANLLGFKGCFSVDSLGRSGGLSILWKDPIAVCIKSFSQGHIDCVIQHDTKRWRFTGVYGNPDASLRYLTWELLDRLANLHEFKDLPWLLGGDFNEICFDSEKLGGNKRPNSQLEAFRKCLDGCNVQSLNCDGDQFTWVNRRFEDGLIFEKLDRFVSSFEWRMLYPIVKCTSLDFYHSDHRPICLHFGAVYSSTQAPVNNSLRCFRFEAVWLKDPACESVVLEGWNSDSGNVNDLVAKIKSCSRYLQQWTKSSLQFRPRKIKVK
ncbi:uncharacterized protein [Henckelia pumila]|uniref:uncharacterized protein n=1 Tax=Henckelia pumila TaxID=405737 RepID=UPI003C6DF891